MYDICPTKVDSKRVVACLLSQTVDMLSDSRHVICCYMRALILYKHFHLRQNLYTNILPYPLVQKLFFLACHFRSCKM